MTEYFSTATLPSVTNHTPYATLTPELILDAVESVGLHCTGSLLALNSYENRVYQIGIENAQPLIAKFYRPHRWKNAAIIEEHQFAIELTDHEIPVVAPLVIENLTLHTYHDFRFALFPRVGGRPLELDNLEHLEWMGRFIGRIHAVGAVKAFEHRIQLDVKTYGHNPYEFLIANEFIPTMIKPNYCAIATSVLQQIETIFANHHPITLLRLHGDCHAGNVLWNNGPQFVDLDDCLMGPAIQDLWMLLSGNTEQVKVQLDRILDGYEEFHEFNYKELHLIEALRTLRMIHYSGWLAKRWQDPAFPLNFPWFNTQRYWEEQMYHLREQADLLDAII